MLSYWYFVFNKKKQFFYFDYKIFLVFFNFTYYVFDLSLITVILTLNVLFVSCNFKVEFIFFRTERHGDFESSISTCHSQKKPRTRNNEILSSYSSSKFLLKPGQKRSYQPTGNFINCYLIKIKFILNNTVVYFNFLFWFLTFRHNPRGNVVLPHTVKKLLFIYW